jgi:hypothetical protein
VTTPADPNNTLVAILVNAGGGSAGRGSGVIVLPTPSVVVPAPIPVQSVGAPGRQVFGSLVLFQTTVEAPGLVLETAVDVPLEQLEQKPLKLSQTEGNSEGSTVERIDRDFFGPAPAADKTVQGEGETPAAEVRSAGESDE